MLAWLLTAASALRARSNAKFVVIANVVWSSLPSLYSLHISLRKPRLLITSQSAMLVQGERCIVDQTAWMKPSPNMSFYPSKIEKGSDRVKKPYMHSSKILSASSDTFIRQAWPSVDTSSSDQVSLNQLKHRCWACSARLITIRY